MKLKAKLMNTETKRTAKVYWNADFQEYVVKLWQGMDFLPDSTYYTDDMDDAEATAQKMIA